MFKIVCLKNFCCKKTSKYLKKLKIYLLFSFSCFLNGIHMLLIFNKIKRFLFFKQRYMLKFFVLRLEYFLKARRFCNLKVILL